MGYHNYTEHETNSQIELNIPRIVYMHDQDPKDANRTVSIHCQAHYVYQDLKGSLSIHCFISHMILRIYTRLKASVANEML